MWLLLFKIGKTFNNNHVKFVEVLKAQVLHGVESTSAEQRSIEHQFLQLQDLATSLEFC